MTTSYELSKRLHDAGIVVESEIRDVVGYEGLYTVSEAGEVFSLPRSGVGLKAKKRKTQVGKRGYEYVDLWKQNRAKTITVHRIVAQAFLPRINGRDVVNHKDGNRTNNHASNLEWCTTRENALHALNELGTMNCWKGSRNPHSKLDRDDVLLIRQVKAEHPEVSNPVLGRLFGVSTQSIWAIVKGKNWKSAIHLKKEGVL